MTRIYCTFAGFRPRLLSQHIAAAYPERVADVLSIRYVPPLLMRLDASTLEPDDDDARTYISYADPVALAIGGRDDDLYPVHFPQRPACVSTRRAILLAWSATPARLS